MLRICITFFLSIFVLAISALGSPAFAVVEDGSIDDSNFTINVGDITPTSSALGGAGSSETINNALTTILNKLIIIFGALAVLIMTIGAGFMIIYHGQDDLLSRWKSIFMAGIIALVVALSAGLIVQIFAYILYS